MSNQENSDSAKIAGEDTRKMPSFMSGCDKDLPLEGEYFDTATAKLYLDALDGRSAKQVGDFEMPEESGFVSYVLDRLTSKKVAPARVPKRVDPVDLPIGTLDPFFGRSLSMIRDEDLKTL